MALWMRESDERLYGQARRRSTEEAARGAANGLPARRAGSHAGGRVRLVMSRHGAGSHATRARAGVRELRQPEIRREAQGHGDSPVRTQRAVHVYGGDRKSTPLNSSHTLISYSGFCFEKKT